MELVFYYDIVCPYAYLAAQKIEAVAARTGATLTWQPVLLGGVFRALGGQDNPNTTLSDAKRRLGQQDLQRWAALANVPLRFHPAHPRRTVEAMRLLVAAPAAARPALTQALYRAYFVAGLDVADRDVLATVAREQGLDESLVRTGIDAPEVKEALRAATARAVDDGVFGVPAYVVVQGDTRTLYWGQDRLNLVEAALGGQALAAPAGQGSGSGETVRFYYDFASPYAYLGNTQIEAVAARHGAKVAYRPMLLGALFRQIGTPMVPMQTFAPAKQRYFARDMQDWAQHWQVPWRWPSRFPLRTVLPLRVVLAAGEANMGMLTRAIFHAYWVDDQDISDATVLRAVVQACGGDPAWVDAAEAASDALKAALVANTDEAREAGVVGAPSFVVRGALLWGQDRLDMLDAILAGRLDTAEQANA